MKKIFRIPWYPRVEVSYRKAFWAIDAFLLDALTSLLYDKNLKMTCRS